MISRSEQSAFAERRSVNGFDGLVQFFAEARRLQDQLLAELGVAILTIDSSEGRWPSYYAQIYDYLSIPCTETYRQNSATRPCGSRGIGGGNAFMKLRSLSSGCETRPAKGELARAGSKPCDGCRNKGLGSGLVSKRITSVTVIGGSFVHLQSDNAPHRSIILELIGGHGEVFGIKADGLLEGP